MASGHALSLLGYSAYPPSLPFFLGGVMEGISLGGLFGVGLEFKLLSWYILYSGVGLRRLPDCLGPTSG